MAYSLKNVADQKPATLVATIMAGVTIVHLAWQAAGDSPLSGDVLLGIESFLGLLLGLFWVDATTVNVNVAQGNVDDAFLQGLALEPEQFDALRSLGGEGVEVSFAPPAEPAVDDALATAEPVPPERPEE